MRDRARAAGVTLVESMVAIALVALVATYAMPSFVAWRQRDRVDARATAMLAALAAARVEAVSRGVRVVLCRGDGSAGQPCLAAQHRCDGEGAWSCAWAVVALDAAAPGDTARGTVLRRIPADSGVRVEGAVADVVFTPPAGQVIGGFRRFEFSARARISSTGGPVASRCLRIAAGGRARLSPGRCGAAG
ncbi:pilus assembly FimT family protein [Burkholderia glumae]|uniref:pilus assembly FimT family protein n=1 Tax=Burkholderia glumae TaxID=337 RepID=UPI002151F95E|nr:GspH/FimT family pseudopilin [Burkholderia glumae]UVT00918.1 prepilin-type N-terminal cleavage/methylation domain-containing protein [Burkholderia glumae]